MSQKHEAAVSCSPGVYRLGGVGLGMWRRASWAMHGSVHGWCMAWCMGGNDDVGGGGINECVYYLDW